MNSFRQQQLLEYRILPETLRQVRDAGGQGPIVDELAALIDQAEQLDRIAADFTVPTIPAPDPLADRLTGDLDQALTDALAAETDRAARRAVATRLAGCAADAKVAAVARYRQVAKGKLIASMQPAFATVRDRLAELVTAHPVIVQLDESTALTSTAAVRDAYIEAHDAAARLSAALNVGDMLRQTHELDRNYPHLHLDLTAVTDKRAREIRNLLTGDAYGQAAGMAPRPQPSLLHLVAEGVRPLLLTAPQLREREQQEQRRIEDAAERRRGALTRG